MKLGGIWGETEGKDEGRTENIYRYEILKKKKKKKAWNENKRDEVTSWLLDVENFLYNCGLLWPASFIKPHWPLLFRQTSVWVGKEEEISTFVHHPYRLDYLQMGSVTKLNFSFYYCLE